MNLYADLKAFKTQLLRDDDSSERDDLYLHYLENASRVIDNYVGGSENWRHFYTWEGTRTFETGAYGDEERFQYYGGKISGLFDRSDYPTRSSRDKEALVIPDLLDIDNATVSVSGSDVTNSFYFEPRNTYPKIKLVPKNGLLPVTRELSIEGKWGYSDVRTSVTAIEGSLNDSDADIDVDDTRKLSIGMNIWLESEQCYISDMITEDAEDDGSVPGTITVERGFNGSEAAEHDDDTVVKVQRIEAPIRQSCIDLALRKHRGRDVEWEGQGSDNEGLAEMLAPISLQITHYRRGRMKFYHI